MVMAQILRLLKWTQDQISQLACFCNNTENSPRHSPSHLPLSPFLLLCMPTLQTPPPSLIYLPLSLPNLSPFHPTLSPAATLLNFPFPLAGFVYVWS